MVSWLMDIHSSVNAKQLAKIKEDLINNSKTMLVSFNNTRRKNN
jgi:hypothetical protein